MKKLLTLLFILAIISTIHAQRNMIPFQSNDKWGYKYENDTVAIPAQFLAAKDFNSGGIALVKDQTGWGYINRLGNIIVRPVVLNEQAEAFSEGFARFTQKQKFGIFSDAGKIVVPAVFDYISTFHDGLAAACMGCTVTNNGKTITAQGGKWGYINNEGEIVIKLKYDEVTDFKNGKGSGKVKNEWKSISKPAKKLPNKK